MQYNIHLKRNEVVRLDVLWYFPVGREEVSRWKDFGADRAAGSWTQFHTEEGNRRRRYVPLGRATILVTLDRDVFNEEKSSRDARVRT